MNANIEVISENNRIYLEKLDTDFLNENLYCFKLSDNKLNAIRKRPIQLTERYSLRNSTYRRMFLSIRLILLTSRITHYKVKGYNVKS